MKTVNNEYRINAALGVIKDLREAIQSDIDNADEAMIIYGAVDRLENYMTLIDGIEFYLTQKD